MSKINKSGRHWYNNGVIQVTIQDVKKRNTAHKNNLNYIELYTKHDVTKLLYAALSSNV